MGDRLSRRDLLKAGGALAAVTVGPQLGCQVALAQTPKRGGTISLRLWDPPHFDPHLTISYKTNVLYTFTHSRLLKYKAGPGVSPGSFILEGDLAESWAQPNETTYIFKLRKGVRWHAKPPVNGRELTAEDVKYTFDRFVNEKGNAYRSGLPYLDKVEATVDEDNASRMAAFIAGKYDLGWEAAGTINRVDWVQIRDTLKQRRPKIQSQ